MAAWDDAGEQLAEDRPGQMSGRVGFGSGQGRVTGRIGRPAPDPYLSPGRVGLARAPCAGVSGRGFFGLGRVLGQKSRAVPGPLIVAGQKIRPAPTRHVARVGSGRVFFGRVGSGCSGRVTHAQVYVRVGNQISGRFAARQTREIIWQYLVSTTVRRKKLRTAFRLKKEKKNQSVW